METDNTKETAMTFGMTQHDKVINILGVAPNSTVRDLMEATGINHPGQVRRVLKELRERGLAEAVSTLPDGNPRQWRLASFHVQPELRPDPVATPEDSYGGSILDDQTFLV